MDRRGFLVALAAGTVAGLAGCRPGHTAGAPPTGQTDIVLDPTPSADQDPIGLSVSGAPALPTPTAPPSPTGITRVAPDRWINELPGTGNNMALTVDDGISSEVVAAYTQFALDSGARLTFCVTGTYPSWTENAAALRPLVESGQVQLANHTWSHPDLRSLSDREIGRQLTDTEDLIKKTYGVSARPFFRPPYGYYNDRVRRVAGDIGYSVTTMWMGSLGDSSLLTEEQVIANAQQWFGAQRIIIGHANHPAVTHTYGRLLEIIQAKKLQLVTLNDIFAAPAPR